MERFLLCALVLLRPLDAADMARTQDLSFQAKTTRGLPLCPEGKGQQPQQLDGPTVQGTPRPSLTAGFLTTRLDLHLWPTDRSLETNDCSSFKDGSRWKYWTNKVIDLMLVLDAMLLSLLLCWGLSLWWRALCPALHDPEQNRLLTTSSPHGQQEYGAITETLPSAAEGHDSPHVEKEEEKHDNDKATLLSTIESRREAVPLCGLEDKTEEPKSVSDMAA